MIELLLLLSPIFAKPGKIFTGQHCKKEVNGQPLAQAYKSKWNDPPFRFLRLIGLQNCNVTAYFSFDSSRKLVSIFWAPLILWMWKNICFLDWLHFPPDQHSDSDQHSAIFPILLLWNRLQQKRGGTPLQERPVVVLPRSGSFPRDLQTRRPDLNQKEREKGWPWSGHSRSSS